MSPPIVLLGPTASGKSALAMALARECGGVEIVSADAMAVYRGMDIGTAKPTPADRVEVPHHGIDVVDPGDDYTVAQHQALAKEAIAATERRGARPVLVGGSGLYVRAIVDDLEIPGRFPDVAAELEAEPDTAALHRRLVALDPAAAARTTDSNRRRILRALEVSVGSGRPFSSYGPGLDAYPAVPFVQVGLRVDRKLLDQRIERRYHQQLADGFVEEVVQLSERPLSRTAAQALGYKELLQYVRGRCSLDEALELAIRRTRRFARRQQRWFERDPRVRWVDAVGKPMDVLAEVLGHYEPAAADRPDGDRTDLSCN